MKQTFVSMLAGMLLAAALAGCSGENTATPPTPVALTAEAVGHYCQMYVLDHDGPKAQIHLKGSENPLWFAQVTNAVSYMRDQEQTAEMTAIYVNDMAKAVSWTEPGRDNWIDANKAIYVIGSKKTGGMGTPEAVPFGTEATAKAFVAKEGGKLVTLKDIPDDYLNQQAVTEMHDMPSNKLQGS